MWTSDISPAWDEVGPAQELPSRTGSPSNHIDLAGQGENTHTHTPSPSPAPGHASSSQLVSRMEGASLCGHCCINIHITQSQKGLEAPRSQELERSGGSCRGGGGGTSLFQDTGSQTLGQWGLTVNQESKNLSLRRTAEFTQLATRVTLGNLLGSAEPHSSGTTSPGYQ